MNVETQVNYSLRISHSLSPWWECNSLSPSRPGAWRLVEGPLQNCSVLRTATLLLSQFPKWSDSCFTGAISRSGHSPRYKPGTTLTWEASLHFLSEVHIWSHKLLPMMFLLQEKLPQPFFSPAPTPPPSFGLSVPQDFAWLPDFTESGILPLTLMLAPSTALNSLSSTLHWAPPSRGLSYSSLISWV